MFAKKIFVLLFLAGCVRNMPVAKKILIAKPIINDVVIDFKPIKNSVIIGNKICIDKENIENLLYNIKISRIYFNQQTFNLVLTQDYYSKVIEDLGGSEK